MRGLKFLGDTFEDFLEWGQNEKQLQNELLD